MSASFVPTDSDSILAEVLSDFTTTTGRTLLPGQPEYAFCASMAYRLVLERQRMNAVGNSQLLAFSTAPILDYLVQLVGIERLAPQYAVCTLHFTLVLGHGDVIIPSGTRVISTDGKVVFATKNDVSVLAGILVANVDAECMTSGLIGNDYAIGTISMIQDVQAYLSTASNIDITAGGSDEETDEQLRARAYKAPSAFSVAGSREAYKFFTFSASPLVIDVSVVSHSDNPVIPYGQVNIYPLLANGNVADGALTAVIQAALSDEKVRPLTDTVVVQTPVKVLYEVNVDIIKFTKASNSDILALVNPTLIAFGKAKMKIMGLDIVNSEIESICRVAGVYDLTVTIIPTGKSLTGDNLVMDLNEFPYLNNFTVNITGANNG